MNYLEQESASVLVDGVIQELKEKYVSPQVARIPGRGAAPCSRQSLSPLRRPKADDEPAVTGEGPGTPGRLEKSDRDPLRVYGVNALLARHRG